MCSHFPFSTCSIDLCCYHCRPLGGHVYSFGELLWRDVSVPVSAPLLEKTLVGKTMVRVAAGGFHCGALCEQGYVYMWGENTAGQCGLSEQGSVTNVTGWLKAFRPFKKANVFVCLVQVFLLFQAKINDLGFFFVSSRAVFSQCCGQRGCSTSSGSCCESGLWTGAQSGLVNTE